ncbi:Protein of unknown function [Gryllus bimaculatus]|nr:Protein of unknown function [Gryllus bimaculatus]
MCLSVKRSAEPVSKNMFELAKAVLYVLIALTGLQSGTIVYTFRIDYANVINSIVFIVNQTDLPETKRLTKVPAEMQLLTTCRCYCQQEYDTKSARDGRLFKLPSTKEQREMEF